MGKSFPPPMTECFLSPLSSHAIVYTLDVCKTMTVLFQNRYALNAYAFCHCFASSAHAEKMQALFRLCLLSATDRGFSRRAPRIARNAQNPTGKDSKTPFHAFTTLLNKQWDSLRNASIAITPGRATIHRSVAFSARSNPTLRCETKTKAPCSRCLCFRWRRRWDSNPRTGNPVN